MSDLLVEVSKQARTEYVGFLELFEGLPVKSPQVASILPPEFDKLPPDLQFKPGISDVRIQDQYKVVSTTLSRLVNLCNECLPCAETENEEIMLAVQNALQLAHGIYTVTSLLSKLSVYNSQIDGLVIELQETNEKVLAMVMPQALLTQQLLASKDIKYESMYRQQYTEYHDAVMEVIDNRYQLQHRLKSTVSESENTGLIDQSSAYCVQLDVGFVENCQLAEQAIKSQYSRRKGVEFLLQDDVTERGIRDILHLLSQAEPQFESGKLSQSLADFNMDGAMTQQGHDSVSCSVILADKSSDITALQSQLLDWQKLYELQKQVKDHIGSTEFDSILCHGSLLIADCEEIIKRVASLVDKYAFLPQARTLDQECRSFKSEVARTKLDLVLQQKRSDECRKLRQARVASAGGKGDVLYPKFKTGIDFARWFSDFSKFGTDLSDKESAYKHLLSACADNSTALKLVKAAANYEEGMAELWTDFNQSHSQGTQLVNRIFQSKPASDIYAQQRLLTSFKVSMFELRSQGYSKYISDAVIRFMASCLMDDDHKSWRRLYRDKGLDQPGVTDEQVADEFLSFLNGLRLDGNAYISDRKLSKLLSQANQAEKGERKDVVRNSSHSHSHESSQKGKLGSGKGNGKGNWQRAGRRFKKKANDRPVHNNSQQIKGEPKKDIKCNYCAQQHSVYSCSLLKSQVASGKVDVISNLRAKRVCVGCLLSLDLKDQKTGQHKCRDYFISKSANGVLQKHPLSCQQQCKVGQQPLHYSLCKSHPPGRAEALNVNNSCFLITENSCPSSPPPPPPAPLHCSSSTQVVASWAEEVEQTFPAQMYSDPALHGTQQPAVFGRDCVPAQIYNDPGHGPMMPVVPGRVCLLGGNKINSWDIAEPRAPGGTPHLPSQDPGHQGPLNDVTQITNIHKLKNLAR